MNSINRVFLLVACCTVLLTACNKADRSNPQQEIATSPAVNVAGITTHVKSALNN